MNERTVNVGPLRDERELEFQQNPMIEQVCSLKYLRDGAEGIVPGVHLSNRGLVTQFVEESVPQLSSDTIERRVFDEGFGSAGIRVAGDLSSHPG
jgi:hypothetical protein